jgi:hypothetical protein
MGEDGDLSLQLLICRRFKGRSRTPAHASATPLRLPGKPFEILRGFDSPALTVALTAWPCRFGASCAVGSHWHEPA